MTKNNILKARAEAERFIERCDELMERENKTYKWVLGSKYSGAVRRSSMELTRALATMRKP